MEAPPSRNIGPNLDLQAFGDYVDEHSCRGFCNLHSRPVSFLPFKYLEAYFKYVGEAKTDNLETVLRYLLQEEYQGQRSLRSVYRRYLPILAILIFIGKGEYINLFLHRPSLCGDKLPFDDIHARHLPEEIRSEFRRAQWQFCAHLFDNSDVPDVELLDGEILPFTSRNLVAEGSSARIYKVQLHNDYNRLHESLDEEDEDVNQADTESQCFAIKTYDATDTEALACYKSELRALQRLTEAPGIVAFFGSFRQCNTLNIILEYADQGNLAQYMEKHKGPTTKDDARKFWTKFNEITQGLANIHNIEPSSVNRNGTYQGWHQDIKPDNILVFSNGKTSPYEFEFKLADLGLCQLERSQLDTINATTAYKIGSRTYSDPELFRARETVIQNLKVRQAIDVWSMACVFSVVSTWTVKNWEGVGEYSTKRKSAPSRRYGFDNDTDCFHDGISVLEEVKDWHTYLSQQSCDEDEFTRSLWDGLLSSTFVAWETRHDAINFSMRAKMCIDQYLSQSAPVRARPEQRLPELHSRSLNNHQPTVTDPTWPFAEFANYKRMPKPRSAPFSWLMNDVKARNHVFLIDDSKSMRPHWKNVEKVVSALAYFFKALDESDIELYFTNSRSRRSYYSTAPFVYDVWNRYKQLDHESNPSPILQKIFDDHKQMLEYGKRHRWHGIPHGPVGSAPMTIYFLTDGRWTSHSDLRDVIEQMVNFMVSTQMPRNHIAIQFIQFGEDGKADELLRRYEDLSISINDRDYDIVDVERHDGNAWKMLLGAVNMSFD